MCRSLGTCEGKPMRKRRFAHNLLIRGGLRAYALTLPLLEFKCTRYEIKSRDMNEKGKDFIFYNKSYVPSAGLHGPLHMVCALCPCSDPSARSACSHIVVLPAAAWAEWWRGACTYSNIFFLFSLND